MTDFVYSNDLPEDDTPAATMRPLLTDDTGMIQGPVIEGTYARLDGTNQPFTGAIVNDSPPSGVYGIVEGHAGDLAVTQFQRDGVNRFLFGMPSSSDAIYIFSYEKGGSLATFSPTLITFAEAVAVPELTATGDVTIQKAGPYLNLSAVSSNGGIRFKDSIDATRWQLDMLADGRIRLFSNDSAVNVFLVLTDGAISFAAAPSVTVPAVADGATAAAAQQTAKDAATGQVQIDGIEVGDTGWRDITASLLNGNTAGGCFIRRTGNMIEFSFGNLDGTVKTSNVFFTCSNGFRANTLGASSNSRVQENVSKSANSMPTEGFGINTTGTNNQDIQQSGDWTVDKGYGRFTYSTSDNWPSTLPGIAA